MRFEVDWSDVRRQMEKVEALRKEPRGGADLAYELGSLAHLLEELKSFDRARIARMESLAEYRRLDDAESRDRMRRTVTKLREDLVELGELDEALAVAREEHALYRDVSDQDLGPSFRHGARYAITTILTSLGRHDEALASTAACVRELRELPHECKSVSRYQLAHSLEDYAKRLITAGRHEDALAATKEAVELWRTKKADDPYLLVLALDKLVARLAQVGRLDEVSSVASELVSFWERLEPTDTWQVANLAASLCNAGNSLKYLGLFREALAAYEASVVWHRKLRVQADSSHEEAVRAKANLEKEKEENDEYWDDEDGDCANVIDRVAGTGKSVVDSERGLGRALRNLSSLLHTLNRLDDALVTSTQAMDLARRQGGEDLAMLLNNRACLLETLGRHADAVEAAAEAVSLCLDAEDVALARITLSVALSSAGRQDEALAESSSALEACEKLADDAVRAHAWHDHGLVRSRRGEHAEALAASAEAVRRFERLDPTRFTIELAEALVRFAEVRFTAGESLDSACEAAARATTLYAALTARTPEAFSESLERARKLARSPPHDGG